MVTADVAADGEWHDAGFTYDGSHITAYFDGVQSGTPLSVPEDTVRHSFASILGKRVYSSSGFFTGQLSDFVVYDVALTDEDIKDYQNGIIRPNGLILWGRMDESDYSEGLMDFSFTGHVGTTHGASPLQDLVSIVIVDPPTGGSVVSHSDGTVTYTPSTHFSGTDRFSYQVRDNHYALSNTATVKITVTGSAVYVNHAATGLNDGRSWENAFTSIHDALRFAAPEDEIWVVAGTYTPDVGGEQTAGDRNATFQLVENVGLYGGFDGTETDRNERDVRRNETILSGDLRGNDVEFNNTNDNSFHVVTGARHAILDGVTVTGGASSGLFNDHTPISVNQCLFAYNKGGAINNNQAPATIREVIFRQNSYAIRNNNTICDRHRVTIVNCIFLDNGTGVVQSFAPGAIDNNNLHYKHMCYPNDWFASAGIALRNCSFVSNDRSMNIYFGEFIQYVQGAPEVHAYGNVDIKNTIFEGDNTLLVRFPVTWFSDSPIYYFSISNSVIKEPCSDDSEYSRCFRSIANIDADPLFVDITDPDGPDDIFGTSDDGLQLSSGSPCINTGSDGAPASDILGVTRPQGDGYDMGPYEFEVPTSTVEFASPTTETADESNTDYAILLRLVLPEGEVLDTDAVVDVIDLDTGSAIAKVDYAAFSPTPIRFPAGSEDGAIQPFMLKIFQDGDVEDNESILLQVTNFQGSLKPGIKVFHTVMITDDDAGNLRPTAMDDEGETNQGQRVILDLTGNDMDDDGTIDPSTVEFLVRPYVASFDGTDDRIIWGDLDLDGTPTLSKFIHFRTTNTSGVLFDTQIGGGADAGLMLGDGVLRLRCAFTDAGVQVIDLVSTDTAADGTWHSAGFTYDGSTLAAYFDGATAGTPLAIPNDTIRHRFPSTCGGRIFSDSLFFTGELADFVVYDTAISANEVRNYHRGGVPMHDLVLWGTMEESDYSEGLVDASGSENDGVSAGAVPIVGPTVPENGTLIDHGDGTVTYTPNPNFSGEDRFTYTVRDEKGAISNVATVVLVVNGAPMAGDDEAETNSGQSVTINLINNDTDSEGVIDPSSVAIIHPRYVAHFDGVDDKIVWGDVGLHGTSAFSKFIRFRTTDRKAVLFDVEFGAGKDGGLTIGGGMLKLRCTFHNAGTQAIDIVSDAIAADGNWHTAGFTYDGATLTPYFDGTMMGTPLSIPDDTAYHHYSCTCGGRVLSDTIFFAGELADFVVYDIAVSPDDILNYHNHEVRTDNLLLWGKMDESDYSNGLADSGNNGYRGVSDGAVPIVDPAVPLLPAHGTVITHSDGTVTYTPNPDFFGEDRFEYTVSDEQGAVSNIATVVVTINQPPVAVDDAVETIEGESVVIAVVDNDTDEDGHIEPSTVQIVQPRHVAHFDGVDDKISWGDLGLDATPALSKFIRFRTTDHSGVLFDTQFGGGADGGLTIVGGMLRLRCAFNDAGLQVINIISADAAADGTWHTAGFAYDGSTLTTYFDGAAMGTTLSIPGDTIRHHYPSTCGGRIFSNSLFYTGELADFVVYNAGLSATEVMSYHSGTTPTVGLVLWGTMDEGDYAGGLADASGNGHTGTSAGAVPIIDPLAPITPQNGSVVNHGDGTITYTPNAGFVGDDHVEYTVEDNDKAVSNIATVTITIQPETTSAQATPIAMQQSENSTPGPMGLALPTAEALGVTGARTMYEDAEDGTIDGWWVYGEGKVTNVVEDSGNRVIATEGSVTGDPFRLGVADHRDWNNTQEFSAAFTLLMEDYAAVYFRINTTEGEKYLCYRPGPDACETSSNVIIFGLGVEADGQWHTLSRDLANDLGTALPSAKILAVKDFYVYGSLKLDDLMLFDRGFQPSL